MDKFIDWHPADIIAGLRKKGTSLAAESRRNGLSSSTLANALTRPWPKGELIIANALETDPWVIWPSRYHDPHTHQFIDRTQMMRPRQTTAPGQTSEGCCYGLFAFDAFDIRTKRLKLVFDTFVAAVNVVNTIDNRRTFRNTARQYQAG